MNPWKRFATILLCVVCVLTGYSDGFSQLTPANSDGVIAIANNWLALGQEMNWGWMTTSNFSPASIQEIRLQGELLAFSLPANGEGYIVIPAYYELPPITAYSTTSSLDVTQEEGFCGMLKEVLSYKIHLIQDYFENPNPPPELLALPYVISDYRTQWQEYSGDYSTFIKAVENGNFSRGMDSEDQMEEPHGILDIGPLLTSSWHQQYPYYNDCPDGDGGRCVVGCVATAMTQIMNYWKYPPSGTGSYNYWWDGDQSCGGSTSGQNLSATFSDSYDWDNILDIYSGGETAAQRVAVAELSYEAGVSINMDYGACGSGTWTWWVMDAFTSYFDYSDEIDKEDRSAYASADDWFVMLQTELDFSRPIQYRVAGHSIVCDGWRVSGTNQVHMNYGWNTGHNTWYTVDALYLGDPPNEYAIRRIFPDVGTLTLTAPNGGEVWMIDDDETITWSSEIFTGNVDLSINRSYPGGYWDTIADDTPNDGEYIWTVNGFITANARIRVVNSMVISVGDTSDADFEITEMNPTITVTAPDGGETWDVDADEDITWTSQDVTGNVKIELDRSYPSSWETLYASTSNDGVQSWIVTSPATSDARIRISSINEPSAVDVSAGNFTIVESVGPPSIQHDPLDDGEPGDVLVVAFAYDDMAGVSMKAFHRQVGAVEWDSTAMSGTGNPNEFSATLSLPDAGDYEYYLRAIDVGSETDYTDVYDFQLYPFCGTTISYDNGSADRFNWAGVEEFRWAVRFTPAATPFVLCGARVGISPDKPDAAHTHFYVEVYDESGGEPGTLLFSDTTSSIGNVVGGLPTRQTHWANVVLRDGSGEPLELYGDFFIAVGNPDTLIYEAFARDTTGTNSDRSFLYDGCTEAWYNENDAWENCKVGNRLIRALGYTQSPPEVVVYRAGDDAELHWSNTGAPFYRIYSDTTPFGAYATLEGSASDTLFVDINAASSSDKKFYRVMSSTLP